VSRIGRLPVTIPSGVEVKAIRNELSVKGPNGELKRSFSPIITIEMDGNQIVVTRSTDEPSVRALHGTTRALIQNMVTGVSTGFTRVMEIQGVGYRAEMDGQKLVLYVGYSHPIVIEPPQGIRFEVDTKTRILKINGFDKEAVGQMAADIRKIRPPEPYKGKGIRYQNEIVRRKAGKSAKTAQ
jgi:large subunit ribosomal protein L6